MPDIHLEVFCPKNCGFEGYESEKHKFKLHTKIYGVPFTSSMG